MRSLVQPGPAHPRRIDSFANAAQNLTYTIQPGVSLLKGVTEPLVEAGFQAAALRFSSATVEPFHYVMPAFAPDASHVAYFSASRAPAGQTRIQRANATFGFHDGRPFLHCHAAWIEADGQRRGGHVLNDETILTSRIQVRAWGFERLRFETSGDPETNFTLFQLSGESSPGAGAVLARVRPNQDIVSAIETIAREHGMPDAVIQGSVGSLVGTQFEDGRQVADHATEVLITGGVIRDGIAAVDVVSVDMAGHMHEGRLTRGENAVCITFDVLLERSGDGPEKPGHHAG